MITKNDLKGLLNALGYTKNKNIYSKNFGYNCYIIVNFDKEEITYPDDLVVNDKTTSNFDKNENFVVFECVNKLLEKGYLSKNLELEPRWQLGRGASGGKADILIKDNKGNEFLIIECKTYGEEFDKSWQKTLSDGDQLFSYAQQIKKTKYLCLYASDFVNNKVEYVNKIITLQDNENFLKTLKKNKRLRYKEATDVKELYRVWKDIYNLEYEEIGIFEDKINPYEINKKNYTINDLKKIGFEDSQKKYNEFATILRQHNVSGHENAFDKLVNLFLAKIVDEIEHSNNLKFNWQGIAYDDYYQLQDRLQKLYKDGMHKFLNEEVTYIDNNQLTDAFKLFKNDPDATRDKVMEYFRKLKFYTNNDFAFIDVHNEELFRQNSEILLKMVKMFQDTQLKTEEQNQFLGDLFEGFLDDGVKQSEGQFFTPLPITRFIVSSLPLKEIFEENDEPPKVIDYACGAGHFLTEYATEIKKFVPNEKLQDYYAEIDGIEKEYRLSKVSKVSAFMYGQDNINIIYGDALANNEKIKDNTYSILIANPPYSVKGFLETLDDDERNNYELTKLISKNAYSTNNSIETYFVERAKQLLKSGGVAGIILPASILTNGNNVYTKAREIVLQNFDIISIIELPSGTFGATGTNTIVLFLRKKDENPSLAEHYKNRVDSWFSSKFDKDSIFEDKNILLEYLKMQKIEYNDYVEFLNGTINENLSNNDIFKLYKSDNKIRDVKQIIEIEKDKLYYFMLAYSQKNDVVVVNAPSKKEDIKKYLGYSWSTRKGNEGIKYLGVNDNDENTLSKNKGINNIETPLFNPNDLNDSEKINTIIRKNFEGKTVDEITNDEIKISNLIDMLNFKRSNFDKSISLVAETEIKFNTKYPVDYLGNVCDVLIGGTPSRNNVGYFTGNNLWVSIKEMNGQTIYDTNEKITDEAVINSNVKLIPKGTTLLSFKLSIGKTAIAGKDLYTNEAIAGLIPKDKNKILDKYLFYIFNLNILGVNHVGNKAFGKSLNSDYLRTKVKIPIPPIEVQKEIITKCEDIDNEYEKTRMSIDEYKSKIEQVFTEGGYQSSTVNLSDTSKFELSIGNRVLKNEIKGSGRIPVISANVNQIFGYTDKEIITDYDTPYVLWGIDGDWNTKVIEKGTHFYPTDHCGYLKVLDNNINIKYLRKAFEKAGKTQRFSRTNRASIDRVSALSLKLPTKELQDKVMKEIEKCEAEIEKLKNENSKLVEKRNKIVEQMIFSE